MPIPIKILFSKLTRIDLSAHKVYSLEIKKCSLRKNLKFDVFWLPFSIMAKEHLVIQWLSLLPYKSSFINFNIFETSKDRPNIPPSLKFLEHRVYVLVGGALNQPPHHHHHLDSVMGSKRLRTGRVK